MIDAIARGMNAAAIGDYARDDVTSFDEVVKAISQQFSHICTQTISTNKMAVCARHAAIDTVFIQGHHTKRHERGERFDFESIVL